MYATTNNSMEGFQESNDVRTAFVEAMIQGGHFNLNYIKYVFMDPKIQDMCCMQEQVKEMLAKVGFILDIGQDRQHRVYTHGREFPEACTFTLHAQTSRLNGHGDTSATNKTAEWQRGCLHPGCSPVVDMTIRPWGGTIVVVVVLMLQEAQYINGDVIWLRAYQSCHRVLLE